MGRVAFEARVRGLRLDEIALEVGATIRSGTLRPETSAPGLSPPALPRLDLAEGDRGADGADLELVEVLGRGGMGVVWLATQRSLERPVAIKRAAPSQDGREATALLAEAKTTGMLGHPNIVPVHALGLDSAGAPVLVMKRIEGASLSALVHEREHPAWPDLERRYGGRLEAYVEILMRVADALHFAHQNGFVHRDVKPDNVMVGAFGEVYLLDWGIAAKPGPMRGDSDIVGTPGFLAPEMLDGSTETIDARTDVYLLGATLHAVLTGRPRHDAPAIEQALYLASISEPVVYRSAPLELAAIANRATSCEPDARHASALALREELAAFLRHRGSLRLTARASESLGSLGVDPAPERLASIEGARALAEARFGLTQALREWEGNREAKAMLRSALLASAEAELHHKSPDAAAAIASELDPPEPALDARIAVLREELAESSRLAEDARAEARERDPTLGGGMRALVAALMTVITLAIIGAGFAFTGFTSSASTLALDFLLFGTLVAIVLLFRRWIMANRFGRQAIAIVVLISAGGVFVHVIAWLRDVPPVETTPYFGAVGAVGFGVAAITMAPRLLLAVLSCTALAIVSALWPELSGIASLVNLACCAGAVALESGARRRSTPRA